MQAYGLCTCTRIHAHASAHVCMYAHAAGLVASHGPYDSVSDLLKISGANDHDKELFRKYHAQLTALPPGRMFNERITARQST